MRLSTFLRAAAPALLVGLGLIAGATHAQACIPTSADPETYIELQPVTGGHYYLEERGVPSSLDPLAPAPGSGYLLGQGSTLYEETNDLPGLQRGGNSPFADYFPPGCDQTVLEEGDIVWKDPGSPLADLSGYHVDPSGNIGVPCLFLNGADPIDDVTCGQGPDTEIILLIPGWHPDGPPWTDA